MFDYTILPYADDKIFNKDLNLFESKFPDVQIEELRGDVDDTAIQIYVNNDKRIKFYNDYEVDAVYIESDIDLSDIDFKSVLN